MKKLLTTILCLTFLMGVSIQAAEVSRQSDKEISALSSKETTAQPNKEVPSRLVKNENGSWQLIVNGKPFIMLAGELHNSSASTVDYLNSLWAPLKSLNLNTVLAPIAWEQFEPQEGTFDYTLIDNLIQGARQSGMKLGILWFGSWKNGESSYAPTWVKEDTKRFFRVKTAKGKDIETLSPFCENTMKADAKAFKVLVEYIKKADEATGTVIALQPENEVGIFQDMDYSKASLKAYEQEVPQALIQYMKKNRKQLRKELLSVWEENGTKTFGSWKTVFGDNAWSKSFYTTWQYATYINQVAASAKEVYPLPVFANCWLVQKSEDMPGVYPNGGPVSRVMDIWKAAAPYVDVLAPDIYLSDFKNIVADYHRIDNPLLIPESVMKPAHAFWAFGEHDALCYSPFGVEDGVGNYTFAQSYKVLNELMPLITKYQGSDRMIGIMKTPNESERTVTMGDYQIRITYDAEDAYGLIIQTEKNEFIVSGIHLKVYFTSTDPKKTGYIKQVWEGGYATNGEWKATRLLNGDETYHNAVLIAKGRRTLTSEKANNYNANHSDEIFVYSPSSFQAIWSPGIYRVTTYLR